MAQWQAAPTAPRRGIHPLAHVGSVIGGLLLTPVALLLLDYGARQWRTQVAQFDTSAASGKTALCVVLAFVLLTGVTALGRLSGVGPLVAGIVWGVIPTLVMLLRPMELWHAVDDVPHIYKSQGLFVVSAANFVFPMLAALLIGAAVSARWKR